MGKKYFIAVDNAAAVDIYGAEPYDDSAVTLTPLSEEEYNSIYASLHDDSYAEDEIQKAPFELKEPELGSGYTDETGFIDEYAAVHTAESCYGYEQKETGGYNSDFSEQAVHSGCINQSNFEPYEYPQVSASYGYEEGYRQNSYEDERGNYSDQSYYEPYEYPQDSALYGYEEGYHQNSYGYERGNYSNQGYYEPYEYPQDSVSYRYEEPHYTQTPYEEYHAEASEPSYDNDYNSPEDDEFEFYDDLENNEYNDECFRDLRDIREDKRISEAEQIARAYMEAHPQEYEKHNEPLSDLDSSVCPPSFKDYLFSKVMGWLYRLRGSSPNETATEETESEEDLGPEVSVKEAYAYYLGHMHSFRYRFRICLGVLLVMTYIALGGPVPGMLQYLPVATAACLAMQLMILLLGLDVFTTAILNTCRGKLGVDSLAVFSCLITSADALMILYTKGITPHMPLCVLSSFSFVGVLFGSYMNVRGIRKALRVPLIASKIFSLTGEPEVIPNEITLLKSLKPVSGFLRRLEEASPDETFFTKFSPFVLIIAFLFSAVVALVKSNMSVFVYIFSAVIAPAIPVGALISYALPFYLGTCKTFKSGAAAAGWSGLCDIGMSSNLIVTDRDLFPEGSITIPQVRILDLEKSFIDKEVISYAGTLILTAGSSLSSCFGQLMEQCECKPCAVDNVEFLAGGGIKGMIDGHTVICGNSDLMRLLGIRIPYKLLGSSAVILAIDGIPYGIFNLEYSATDQVREALVNLMRSNRHAIFAVRDFNITPELIHEVFDVATDGYDFPPYLDRFKISSAKPSKDIKISGVICREGLASVTNIAHTGRRIYLATKFNIGVNAVSALAGMLLVFIKLLSAGTVGIGFIFAYMLISLFPLIISMFTTVAV